MDAIPPYLLNKGDTQPLFLRRVMRLTGKSLSIQIFDKPKSNMGRTCIRRFGLTSCGTVATAIVRSTQVGTSLDDVLGLAWFSGIKTFILIGDKGIDMMSFLIMSNAVPVHCPFP